MSVSKDPDRASELFTEGQTLAKNLHAVLVELRPLTADWCHYGIAQLAGDAEVIRRRLSNVERIHGDGRLKGEPHG